MLNKGKAVMADSTNQIDDVGEGGKKTTTMNVSHETNFFSLGIQEWITKFGKSSDFLIALWFIWRRRNALVMANEDWIQYMVMIYISELASDVRKSNAASHHHHTKVPKIVNWCLHLPGEVKLNMDESSLGNPERTGFGCLIRGDKGNWITRFSGYVGISTNMYDELKAIYHGLNHAWNYGFRNIMCHSDSLQAISLVTHDIPQYHIYATIATTIQDLLRRTWTVCLEHSVRETNYPADFLAKLGAREDMEWKVWDSPPSGISPLLTTDQLGHSLALFFFFSRIKKKSSFKIIMRISLIYILKKWAKQVKKNRSDRRTYLKRTEQYIIIN
ncbi:unnamed protein product [Lupinus luteus]|uniref:RNase H type-1 domain-containing protein n=1 Tax=Lupinus luteus TaxID=3873 RepID=A0AAV1Y111_LUPLU